MKERTLIRLAECCYRIEESEEGLKYLDIFEKFIAPKKIYSIHLLRGKFFDFSKEFEKASF